MAVTRSARGSPSVALKRWVARAPATVFPVIGADALWRVEALHARPEVRLVPTPRHATVLLVAGRVLSRHEAQVERVHDQIPHPRATLHWGADAPGPSPSGRTRSLPPPTTVETRGEASVAREGVRDGPGQERPAEDAPAEDAIACLVELHRSLLTGESESEKHRLPDRPPSPWRGLGDHGQGGEGMMGGKPYGRPMAMTHEDIRDGLALDRIVLTIGPFFPHLPPGLVLEMSLQGDVVQEVHVVEEPFPQAVDDDATTRPPRLLRQVSRVLRTAGCAAFADRALRLALSRDASADDVRSLLTRLRWSGALRALPTVELPGGGTVRSRMESRLERARLELEASPSVPAGAESALAAASGTARRGTVGSEILCDLLPGMEWGDALVTAATLELSSRSPTESS